MPKLIALSLLPFMSRHHSHLNTAVSIIGTYRGEMPFYHLLKSFFSTEKKYGSKDRRNIAHLCYCYFRTGKLLNALPVSDRLIYGLFLCSSAPDPVLETLNPDLNRVLSETTSSTPFERLEYLKTIISGIDPFMIFPFEEQLSEGIDRQAFVLSHLVQPDLFLRIRPGKEKHVLATLKNAGINYKQPSEFSLAVPNGTRIEEILAVNRDIVIQDHSSQKTAQFLPEYNAKHQPVKVWDCCAASGGKSIMTYDVIKNIQLTVSDKRPSILHNLRVRFKEAGLPVHNLFVSDLGKDHPGDSKYDLIIADLPCTGSGTWGRSPENLYYFQESDINRYSDLQKKIMANIIPAAVSGGHILYITCSVFKKENENVLDTICTHFKNLTLVHSASIPGYDIKADSMFAALLRVD